MPYSKIPEETLDPDDWEEMRALGHKMVDDMLNFQRDITKGENPRPTSRDIEEICIPLPEKGEGEQKAFEFYQSNIKPYAGANRNLHPRFWGAVVGNGSPYGMLTGILTSGLGASLETTPTIDGYVHRQVIEWIKGMFDYPKEAGGVLVSGGSEANFTGLAVARNARAEVDMKAEGMQGVPRKMTIYVSDGGHHSLERSVELLGIGGRNLRWIPTGDDHRIKVDALKESINRDRKVGYNPFCIIGCAGTVDTGAFDDLNALADLAAEEKMWFHVDAAFGGWVKISKTHRSLADGLERADSVAIDLHKWMYMPYGIGCTLVKDKLAHYRTFVYGHEAQYIKAAYERGQVQDELLSGASSLSLPLSRSFTSLRPYMLLRAYSRDKYSRLIQQNTDQARYLASLIEKDPQMELTAPVATNVVNFRFNPGGLTEDEVKDLNKKIIGEIYKIRFWMISDTVLKGRFTLRAAITNHRSRREDFDYIYNLVKELGKKALQGLKKQ
jgi:glutamate/tyrosine decarboxylase-like PLP-dependent enzyme